MSGTWHQHGHVLQMAVEVWRHRRVDDGQDDGVGLGHWRRAGADALTTPATA